MKLHSLAFAALLFTGLPLASSSAQIGVSITIAPPLLPVVEQPPCPVDGYLWTPGYWGYANVGYYWTPGVWVAPPQVGFLWTPPYWGFNNGVYVFNDGYWGPTVGFYGGLNYGYGYFGNGFAGGQWAGNVFRYNTAVTRVNTSVIHNVYTDRSVVNKQVTLSRASFNGPGGVKAEATAEQKAAAEHRAPATAEQLSRREAASKNPELQASVNKGHPNPAAIRSLDRKEQQAESGQQGKANSDENANRAANERREKAGDESRSADREREDMRATRGDEGEAHTRRVTPEARERENAPIARGETDGAARSSRRTEALPPRQFGPGPAGRREAPPSQQRKRKPTKPEEAPDGQR